MGMSLNEICVIAEVGCNHCGDFQFAKTFVDKLASLQGEQMVQVVKFQKRTPELILSQEELLMPHPCPENSFGKTYGEHRANLEFNILQHKELKSYVESKNLVYSCSVFDWNSLDEILSLEPKMIKISSVNNTDFKMMKYLDDNYKGEIHISLGMTTREEERRLVNVFNNKLCDIVLYACTTNYPVSVGEICLLEVDRLFKTYSGEIKGVGFSAHHIGYVQDVAALALGARYFERHFTLDKSLKGSDQFMSLDLNEISHLAQNLRMVARDLKYKKPEVLESEMFYRIKHKKTEIL